MATMKTISVAVDDELHLQWHHMLHAIALQEGVHEISTSVFLRALLRKAVGTNQSPFDLGWFEGYKAGFAAVMRLLVTVAKQAEATPEILLQHNSVKFYTE